MKMLEKLEAAAGIVFFLGMFGAIVIQVFARYVMHHPLVWPFELSIYCFIYMTYIGAAIAARRRNHVAFDLIYSRFSPRAQAVSTIATNLFIIGIIVYVMPSSFKYIAFVGDIPSSALQIPWAVILSAFPVGMGLVALHLGVQTVHQIQALRAGKAA
jgi:TRAP-type C4-dicarboxylate transport system permease small subunit